MQHQPSPAGVLIFTAGLAHGALPPSSDFEHERGREDNLALPLIMANAMVIVMDAIIAMDAAGRLVLPKSVRHTLNLANRARFRVGTVGNKIELTVVEEAGTQLTRNKRGLLVVKSSGKTFDSVQAIEEMRQERL